MLQCSKILRPTLYFFYACTKTLWERHNVLLQPILHIHTLYLCFTAVTMTLLVCNDTSGHAFHDKSIRKHFNCLDQCGQMGHTKNVNSYLTDPLF